MRHFLIVRLAIRILGGGGWGGRLGGVDDFSDRFDPFAVAGEATGGANGLDYVVASDFGGVYLLDDAVEGVADVAAAAGEEAGGMGVAVDGRVVGDSEIAGDGVGTFPIEEGVFDGLALGMMADTASAAVAGGGTRAALEI